MEKLLYPCSPLAKLSYREREYVKRLGLNQSIGSSEHMIISKIHLRKSILITSYGTVDVSHALFMPSAISYWPLSRTLGQVFISTKVANHSLQIEHTCKKQRWWTLFNDVMLCCESEIFARRGLMTSFWLNLIASVFLWPLTSSHLNAWVLGRIVLSLSFNLKGSMCFKQSHTSAVTLIYCRVLCLSSHLITKQIFIIDAVNCIIIDFVNNVAN